MGKNIGFACVAILISIWLVLPAAAQINEPYLVKDINTDRLSEEVCSNFATLGSTAYFCGRSTDGISALWRTDGTEIGTFVVKQYASDNIALSPSNLVQVEGVIYFSGAGKLWKSDGTEIGTASLGEVTLTSNMVNVGGVLYFGGRDNAEGWELWRTDGTEAGTFRVSNIIEGLGRISIRKIVTIGENLYFVSDDGIHGEELWKSDGTMEGTIMVKDINENSTSMDISSNANNLEVLNGSILFFADDGVHGKELWKSDGSEIGTVMVKDIQLGIFSNGRSRLSPAFNSNLFFFADGDFWKTDGTEIGTVVVDNINIGASESNYYYAISGERLYFAANDGTGEEIWYTDGVNSRLVEDIFPASSSGINELFAHENKIYFTSGFSPQSRKLWSLNANTSDIELLANVSWSEKFSAVGLESKLILKGGQYWRSNRLWVTDGSVAGTTLIADINENSEDASYGEFVKTNNELYFVASDELIGLELWKTTGSAENTHLVHDINGGFNNGSPRDMVNIDGIIYFSATTTDEGRELWISDGTGEGTMLVKNIRPGFFGSDPKDLYELNGILYFSADDSVHGRELWRSDGTSDGTYMIKDVYPGRESAFSKDQIDLVRFNDFVSIDNDIYFAATDGIHGAELWKSDGTTEGTVQVKDINNVTAVPLTFI